MLLLLEHELENGGAGHGATADGGRLETPLPGGHFGCGLQDFETAGHGPCAFDEALGINGHFDVDGFFLLQVPLKGARNSGGSLENRHRWCWIQFDDRFLLWWRGRRALGCCGLGCDCRMGGADGSGGGAEAAAGGVGVVIGVTWDRRARFVGVGGITSSRDSSPALVVWVSSARSVTTGAQRVVGLAQEEAF